MSTHERGVERIDELLLRVLPREHTGRLEPRDGLPACPLAAPATPEEAVEVLHLARAEKWTLLPVGNGTKLGWARPPTRVDLALSSRNLAEIVAYEPDDGTVTARSGTPWSDLVATTRARHHLSPELAGAARATLGGVLGAGMSGLDRLRHGPLRHQVLGMLALHADGSRVKSGGRVVKNVTGYDLHRLWCGSQGTLCFLLEATLRLHPAPPEMAVLRSRCAELAEGVARAHALWRAGVQPLAVVLTGVLGSPDFELAVVLAGRAEALASEIEGLRPHLGPLELRSGKEALRARDELREREFRGGRWPTLTIACRPSKLPGVLERLAAAVLDLAPGALVHPLLATVALELPPEQCGDERRAALEALAGDGVTLHWRGLGVRTPAVRVPSAALALMQRVKHSLDPQGVFARGRFHDEL